MRINKEKIKKFCKTALLFVLNPRLLLCVGLAWLITNGWSYIMMGLGSIWGIGWMMAVSGTYLAFLWLPISPEKIVTFAIAIALLRLLFPKDRQTLAILKNGYEKAKSAIRRRRDKRKSDEGRASGAEPNEDSPLN